MKKILMISYYAPPIGMSGVMRVTKLAKYLPKFGWQPYILTTKPIAYYYYDYQLLNDLKDIPIFRSKSLDLARILYLLKFPSSAVTKGTGKLSLITNFILFPDAKILWEPFAFRLGCKIIEEVKPDIIWATSPPFSTLLIGLRLKQRYGIPLVTDFRDPWPTGFVTPPGTQRKRLETLRNKIIGQSDKVTVVNQVTANKINCPYAQVIENGYDPEDFERPADNLSGFNIVYTGSIWENIEELRIVAEAISDLTDVKLVIIGKCDSKILSKINKHKNVEYLGIRPHSETMSILKGASLLLYLSKPNQIVGIKLYEYFGARRPVLGISQECNEAMRLIETHRVGLSIPPQPEVIRAAILLVKNNQFPFSPIELDRYSRINQVQHLSAIFNDLTG